MTHADLIVVNAHIATLDPDAPEASALAVRDGKVVGRYKSGVAPDDATLKAAIEAALAKAG
jgi:predicted amidohydrolase YtcJ